MSDSMARAEIDDVLSSIRRLVSNDTRCLKPTKMDNSPDQNVPRNAQSKAELPVEDANLSEALVLSPSFRIGDAETKEPTLEPPTVFSATSAAPILGDTPWIADIEKTAIPQAAVNQDDLASSLADIVRSRPMALTDPLPTPAPVSQDAQQDIEAIVAEKLRAELKGPLGERITQSVRKLVRQEIGRLLEEREPK